MKVSLINTYTQGGAALAALRIHQSLLMAGVDSSFLALYKANCKLPQVYDYRDELNPLEQIQKKIRNKILQLSTSKKFSGSQELFSLLETCWNVNKHSLTHSSDIIHLNWTHDFVNLKTFFSVKNRKYVWTAHDHFPFSGGFHYPPETLEPAWNSITKEQHYFLKKLFDSNKIDFVLPSNNLKQIAYDSGVTGANKLHVIKNTVDTDVFKPMNRETCRKKHNIPLNEKVVFYLADHLTIKRKGFHLLEKALEKLPYPVTLLVAGRGKLPQKIGKVNVNHKGLIYDQNMLGELYNCSNLLVNPSLEDISSNTIIEAMACGIPTVSFASGGIPELITPINGLLAERKNEEGLLNLLVQGLETTFNQDNIREKALLEHSPQVISSKYITVYNGL